MATHFLTHQRNSRLIAPLRWTFLAALVLLGYPGPVVGAGFTVTPMLQEVILNDGEGFEIYEASIANETEAIATFEISVIDFGSLNESGGVAFLGATGEFEQKYALASWMQPETSEVTIVPGEERRISVRIENRESLSPGGHYGALIFKNTSSARPEVPNVAINQVLSSLVLVKKTGGAKYGLELASLDQTSHWFAFDPSIVLRFKNPGNVHVVPRGELRVTDPLGRQVYRGIVNEGSAIILPETFREYPLRLFPIEKTFLPGYYTLDLNYRYDGKDEGEDQSRRFLYVPPLSLGIGVGILMLAVFAFWFHHRRVRKPAI